MSTRPVPMCPVLTAAAIGSPSPQGVTCVGSACALWRPVVKNPSASASGLREHFDSDVFEDTGDGVCAQNPAARPWADPAAS